MSSPTNSPSEALVISPEALELANAYLQTPDVNAVASSFGLDVSYVVSTLNRGEVKRYIDAVFADVGFNNRVTMRRAMDAVLRQKFAELEASETGSSKDIADLLALSHKMSMDLLDREIALAKLQQNQDNIRNQVNVQINEGLGTSKYAHLITKLLGNNDAENQSQ